MKEVTIIIPSYNQQDYLAEAVQSAIDQTIPCEIIVIDDGSTDNSLLIARSFEPKVKIVTQVNKGLASARNTGIMNATGKYILPLDADDILLPNAAKELLRIAKQTEADFVAPSFQVFGVGHDTVILMTNPTLNDFRTANRVGYFCLFKKSALLEVGGYSPKMVHGYEDYHLSFNLLTRYKKLVTVSEPLVMYRTKEQSMWRDAIKNHHTDLMNQIYKDFPQILPKNLNEDKENYA